MLTTYYSYRANKYGLISKDLQSNFSSFKWLFSRSYFKSNIFVSFEYNLNNNKLLTLNNNLLLFKVSGIKFINFNLLKLINFNKLLMFNLLKLNYLVNEKF